MRCGTSVELSTALKQLGLSGRLNTACIERLNLTVRQMLAALVRRTWSTTQAAPQLLTDLHGWQAHYHFVRPHETLRVALAQPIERGGKRVPQGYRQRRVAMAAGLTLRRWSVREVLALPHAPPPIGAG
jgi:hypothetical protein